MREDRYIQTRPVARTPSRPVSPGGRGQAAVALRPLRGREGSRVSAQRVFAQFRARPLQRFRLRGNAIDAVSRFFGAHRRQTPSPEKHPLRRSISPFPSRGEGSDFGELWKSERLYRAAAFAALASMTPRGDGHNTPSPLRSPYSTRHRRVCLWFECLVERMQLDFQAAIALPLEHMGGNPAPGLIRSIRVLAHG